MTKTNVVKIITLYENNYNFVYNICIKIPKIWKTRYTESRIKSDYPANMRPDIPSSSPVGKDSVSGLPGPWS